MYYNGLYDESPFSITHLDPDSDPDLDPEGDYEDDDDLAECLEDDDDSDPSDPANASLYFLLREEEGDLF